MSSGVTGADRPATGPLSARRGIAGGLLAGLVGITCCVGPTVAALLGIISAASALDLANNLYGDWGWAFRLAGLAVAVAIVAVARRRARACSVAPGRLRRFVAVLAVTGVATYGVLYAVTTWLGELAQ